MSSKLLGFWDASLGHRSNEAYYSSSTVFMSSLHHKIRFWNGIEIIIVRLMFVGEREGTSGYMFRHNVLRGHLDTPKIVFEKLWL